MKTGAEHRITYDYREGGGDWERAATVSLGTAQVVDLLMWLAVTDPDAYAALSEMEQEAALQGIDDLGAGQAVLPARPN